MQHESERIEYKSRLTNDIYREVAAFANTDGGVIINVNDSRVEFISTGGLPPGLSPDDIRSGISQPRNRRLAEIFHRLKLIESHGAGIRKIYALYRNCAEQPRIDVTPNTFKLTLPNMNAAAKDSEAMATEESPAAIAADENRSGLSGHARRNDRR